MIVKKFIVDDMQEGILLIRNAMGRDAMILSQRPVRGSGLFGLLKKKRLEVYAAAEAEDVAARQQESQTGQYRNAAVDGMLNQSSDRQADNDMDRHFAPGLADTQIQRPQSEPARLAGSQHSQASFNEPSRQEQERLDRLTSLIEQMQKQAQQQDLPRPESTTNKGQQTVDDQRQSDSKNDNMEQLLRQIQRAGVQADFKQQQTASQPTDGQSRQSIIAAEQTITSAGQTTAAAKQTITSAGQTTGFRPDPLPKNQGSAAKLSSGSLTRTVTQPLPTHQHSQIRQKNLMKSDSFTSEPVNETDSIVSGADQPEFNSQETNSDEVQRLDVMYEKLLSADVHLQVANQLVNQAADTARHYDTSTEQILSDLMRDCFSQDGLELKLKKGKQKKVMVAGPAGSGKTSALIKLATQLCRDQKLDIGIISADYQRAAAHLQTQAYASILGLSVYSLKSLSEAPGAKQEMADKDLILIDTPGCNPAFDEQATLAHQLIEIFSPDQLFVCLAAGTSYSMASRLLSFFCDLYDFDLLITKMDEIEACGTLLNFSYLAERPIACLTDSPFVSEQLRFPDVDAIINQLLR